MPASRTTKPIRSILFVPADSPRKIEKAFGTEADAIVLDLEDSVMPSRKSEARQQLAELLSHSPQSYGGQLWVRINPLSSGMALEDLCAVVTPHLAGVLLPKCTGPWDVRTASDYLDALTTKAGMTDDGIGIMAVVTETAAAPFALGEYHKYDQPRLWGLTWGAEDLSSAIGAATNKTPQGEWALTYRMVRSQCLLAAKACGVNAIETLYVDFRDPEGLYGSSLEARREGFTGRFAIHPAQVAPINEAFMPAEAEVDRARRIIAAFDEAGDAGTIAIDGEMLDIPHLNQARHVLKIHEAFAA